MRVLIFLAMCGVVLGCEQLIGLDDLEVSGGDGDADGDSDSESSWEGEPCEVSLLDTIVMDGICQVEDDPCEGGTNPNNEEGSCPSDLVCCIDNDECESFAPALACQDASCEDAGGWPIGCPGGQWCCPLF